MHRNSLKQLIKTNRFQKVSIFLIVILLLQVIYPVLLPQKAHAAALTEASIRLDRMGGGVEYNTTTGYKVLVVLKPATVGTIGKVRVTFPTTNAFTINSTASNFVTSTTGLPSTYQGETLTAATVTGNVASAVSGGAVTFDVTGMSSSTTLYGFFITCNSTTCITNPAIGDAGQHLVTIATLTAASAAIDSQSVAVDTVGSNADQVSVTATVPASFNFALSGNSIALGTLSTSTQTTGNVTVDVDTNANNGWVAWIRSEGAADTLASASTGDSIFSTDSGACVDPARGAEAYLIDVNGAAGTNAGGSLTVATEYNCSDTAGDRQGGVIDTGYEQIAERTGVVESDTLTLTAIVDISPTTEAASDYTDTWEVIGAGNF
jgi:hypothetical protein